MSGVIGALPPHGEQLFLSLWGCFTFLLFVLSFGINLALVLLFLLLSCTFFLLAGGVPYNGTNLGRHANSQKVGPLLHTESVGMPVELSSFTNDRQQMTGSRGT